MPTLSNPSGRLRIPLPLTGSGGSTPVAHSDKIRSDLTPATTGNTVEDHLGDLIARSGHSVAAAYATGTDYEIGDEVFWVDGSGVKHFYLRLTNGRDAANSNPSLLSGDWREIANDLGQVPLAGPNQNTLQALLVRATNGTIDFSTQPTADIAARQTAAQVQALIDAEVLRMASTTRWRGGWAHTTDYAVGDYAIDEGNSNLYRRLTAGQDTSSENPQVNRTDWVEVSGVERLVAFRLRDVFNLLDWSVQLSKAEGDRGHWITRNTQNEGHRYVLPPMCWGFAWEASVRYYYGHVVTHNNSLWVLTPTSTITTPKSGAGTAPGTDGDWQEIAVHSDHPDVRQHWRGDWAANTAYLAGDVVFHNSHAYLISRDYMSTSSGPQTDATAYTLLNDWSGTWADTYYHRGSVVEHNNQAYIAKYNIFPGDPAPDAANNVKWLATGSADVSEFQASVSIAKDAGGDVELQSPGPNGVWTGVSLFPRGSPRTVPVLYRAARPSSAPNNLDIAAVPGSLDELLGTQAGYGLRLRRTAYSLGIGLTANFVGPLANNSVRFRVIYLHSGGGRAFLIDTVPAIPSGTSSSNVFEFNIPLAELRAQRLDPGDTIWVEYTRESGTANDATILAALQSVSLLVEIDGEYLSESDFESAPVQSRPLRDLVSYDRTQPVELVYPSTALTWRATVDGVNPLRNLTGINGQGFEIIQTSLGLPSGISASRNAVRITEAANYDLHFRGRQGFEDRTNNPSLPDEIEYQLVHIPAAHASTSSYPSDENMTFLARQNVYDISKIGGADGTVPMAVEGSGALRHLVPNIPATLDDGNENRHVTFFNTVEVNNQQRPVLVVAQGFYRVRLTARIVFIGDVGANLRMYVRTGNGSENYLNLSRAGTETDPHTQTWIIFDPGEGRQYFDGGSVFGASTRQFEFWFRGASDSDVFDWTHVRSVNLEWELWGPDDHHSTVDIAARSIRAEIGDMFAVRTENDTDYSGSRNVDVYSASLGVANSTDVAGRVLSSAVSASANGAVTIANQSATNWWLVENNRFRSRRDMRAATATFTMPANHARTVEVWRVAPGLTTAELVFSRVFASSGAAQTHSGTVNAVVPGEEVFVRIHGGAVSGATLRLDAKTPEDRPSRQTRLEGLLRPRRLIDEGDIGTPSTWTRVTLLNSFHWQQFPTIRFYVRLRALNSVNEWRAAGTVDTAFLDVLGTNSATGGSTIIGQSRQDSDNRLVLGDADGNYIEIAALDDGGLAILSGDHIYGLKAWGE